MEFMFKFIILFLTLSIQLAAANNSGQSHQVLVTLSPYKFFVEKIAGDTLDINVMVPAGSSAHTYEPTPKQMLSASHADLWFIIGEPFEHRALAVLQTHNPKLITIDMRQGIDLIYAHEGDPENASCVCHCHTGVDLHFWLSPKLAKQQAKTIAEALIRYYPERKNRYIQNLEMFLKELDLLNEEIIKILSPLQNRVILVSHPAYAYFCRDYKIRQLSIEFEGKDPTPQQLTKLLQKAHQNQIRTIFTQRQYSNKGAKLIAAELNAKIVELDPYSEDYINSMREIATRFAQQRFSS
jgi:zinc transport system substrate-binding protein